MAKAVDKKNRQKQQLERLYQEEGQQRENQQESETSNEADHASASISGPDSSVATSTIQTSTSSDYIRLLLIGGVLLVGLLLLYAYDTQTDFLNRIIESTQLI